MYTTKMTSKDQPSAICINHAYGSMSVVGQGIQTYSPMTRAVVPVTHLPHTQPRSVLVTPLSQHSPISSITAASIHQSLTRYLNTGQVVSRDDVHGDIVAGEFDVGIVSSASVISIQSEADVKELWADIEMGGKNYTLVRWLVKETN